METWKDHDSRRVSSQNRFFNPNLLAASLILSVSVLVFSIGNTFIGTSIGSMPIWRGSCAGLASITSANLGSMLSFLARVGLN